MIIKKNKAILATITIINIALLFCNILIMLFFNSNEVSPQGETSLSDNVIFELPDDNILKISVSRLNCETDGEHVENRWTLDEIDFELYKRRVACR